MSQYKLFDQTINFSQSEDRFCELQFFSWKAAENAREEFNNWYTKCGTMYAVLDGFWSALENVVVQHVTAPLYNTLSMKHHIYNISEATYKKECIDLSEAIEVHDLAVEVYNNILDQLDEEREYREYRKSMRSEVIGGGFGLGGAIAGMATAGAINAATGAAHSIVNAFGNASSEGDAEQRKAELYKEARGPFCDAVERCVLCTANAHLSLVNTHSQATISGNFDSDQCSALLESAKKIPNRRTELLLDAFKKCPWYKDLYCYIFDNFPEERKNTIDIGKHFQVDLTSKIDELLSREYTKEAQQSEPLAIEAKKRIKAIMLELGVAESYVLDNLEKDCLARLCQGVEKANEATCNEMLEKILAYDALQKNKAFFTQKVRGRIEAIWAAEDGEIFDNYLLKTNILDPNAVNAGLKFIKEKGRTKSAEQYIKAFSAFNYQNIKKVRRYRICAKPGIISFIIKYIGFAMILFGLYKFTEEWEWSFWTQIFPVIAGIAWEIFIFNLKDEWDTMTINNRIVHPILTMPNDAFEKMHTQLLYKQQSQANVAATNITNTQIATTQTENQEVNK